MPSTAGFPSVSVPVLSKTIVSALPAVSSVSADLIRIPSDAALPVPTIIATGVARPKAHGQEMTSTEMATPSEKESPAPRNIQMQKTINAITITVGTKTPATLSARRAIGALEEEASRTSSIIWASVVSSPTFSARKRIVPYRQIVPACTESPARFVTGRLSPVSAEVSTEELPSRTVPSTGIFPPGRTITTSPAATSAIGSVCSSPFRMTVAVFGARSSRRVTASVVFPFERDSKYLPTVTSVRIVPADSK